MPIIEAALLGVVEGLTEFLPISSTAHLVIGAHVLGIPESAFLGSFIISIQLGAISAVVFLFFRRLLLDVETAKRIIVAFAPTAVAGFLLHQLLKDYLLENLSLIAWALLIGGIVIIAFEKWYAARPPMADVPHGLSYRNAFLIGCAQALAIVPSVSRAGATILGGLALGISRTEIVEFSFFLAIPTMLAATGYDLLKSGASFTADDWEVLAIGFTVSFVAAYACVRWLLRFIETHTFTGFGWYRIALGCALLLWLAI